jgi:hypothetical protein
VLKALPHALAVAGLAAFLLTVAHADDPTSERVPLAAAIATNDGKTFPCRMNWFEGLDAFAYPSAVQAVDGKIHLVFSAQERTVIYHSTFEERDIHPALAR